MRLCQGATTAYVYTPSGGLKATRVDGDMKVHHTNPVEDVTNSTPDVTAKAMALYAFHIMMAPIKGKSYCIPSTFTLIHGSALTLQWTCLTNHYLSFSLGSLQCYSFGYHFQRYAPSSQNVLLHKRLVANWLYSQIDKLTPRCGTFQPGSEALHNPSCDHNEINDDLDGIPNIKWKKEKLYNMCKWLGGGLKGSM
jgi:hypothetical protein